MTSSIIYSVPFGLNNTSRFCLRNEFIRHVIAFNTTKAPEGTNDRTFFAMSRMTLPVIPDTRRHGTHLKSDERSSFSEFSYVIVDICRHSTYDDDVIMLPDIICELGEIGADLPLSVLQLVSSSSVLLFKVPFGPIEVNTVKKQRTPGVSMMSLFLLPMTSSNDIELQSDRSSTSGHFQPLWNLTR
jgi:hypothetical protein